jgi:hypothetical protein
MGPREEAERSLTAARERLDQYIERASLEEALEDRAT